MSSVQNLLWFVHLRPRPKGSSSYLIFLFLQERKLTLVEPSLPQGTVRNTRIPYMDTLSSEQLLLLQIYQHMLIHQFHIFLAYILKFWFLQE